MKVEMELHPNFVSDLVVKQLQEMYEHTKEDYFYTDPEEAQAAISVVLDYFMPPLEYEKWKADKPYKWVGLTDDDIQSILKEWAQAQMTVREMLRETEAKLKEKNT